VNVTHEETENRQAHLHIELENEDMEPYIDRACQRIAQRIRIPGFRAGKAPRRVIENYIGRESIVSEAIGDLVPKVTSEAIIAQELEAIGTPSVTIVQEDPAILKAIVPLRPIVDLASYKEIRLVEDIGEVSAEDVKNVIEELRKNNAPWEPTERAVVYDDLVTMDIHGEVEGDVIADHEGLTYLVAEDNQNPFPGFSSELLGIELGQTKEFTSDVPEDDPDTPGKIAEFKVTVHEVKQRALPDVNDEFAKEIGQGFETLEALEDQVRLDLIGQEERAARSRLEEGALEAAIECSTVEIPPLLIEHEVDHMLEDQQKQLERGGMQMDAYLTTLGKTEDEMRSELNVQANERLTKAWVLNAIAEEHGVEVNADDITEEIERFAASSGDQSDEIRRAFSEPAALDNINQMVRTRKVIEALVEIVTGAEGQSSSKDDAVTSDLEKDIEE
jgi:trigger factor